MSVVVRPFPKPQGPILVQFNMVVSTNTVSIALAKKMGFQIVGRLPSVFRHERLGLVDAYLMHRFL